MNIASLERWLCVGAGAIILVSAMNSAIRKVRPGSVGLALAGGALLRRGITGFCPAYNVLGIDTRPLFERA